MLPAGHQQAASSVHYTTSCKHSLALLEAASSVHYTTSSKHSAPEDGRNYRPKHVDLIDIIIKIFIVASSWLFVLLQIKYSLIF